MKLKHRKLVIDAIVIGTLAVLITIFSLLKNNVAVAEYFYARGISRAWVWVFGNINDGFDFSVFGVITVLFAIALIASFVSCCVLLAKKRRTKALAIFEKTVIVVLSVACIYVCTAGGCYNRMPMPLEKYEGEQLTAEETAELLTLFYADFSEIADSLEYDDSGKSVCPYGFSEMADALVEEYKRLDNDYFSPYTPKVKKALTSKLMSYTGTTGITFQPLGEAVVNCETPNCYLILTAAHELAHAKGVMRERDANLLSYYLLITSDVPYLRYCGYMYSLGYLSSTLNVINSDMYQEVMNLYPMKAALDLAQERAFWATKENILEDISSFFNDLYLKISGLKDGIANYGDPSEVYENIVIVDEEPVVIQQVNYSDTARVLIKLGKERAKQTA